MMVTIITTHAHTRHGKLKPYRFGLPKEAESATNTSFFCSQSLLNALPRTIKVRTQ